MIHSFRLRLALLSAALSGLVLAAFVLTTWSLIRDLRLDHIKQDVRENAEREVRRVRTFDDWRRIESKLVSSLGVRNESDLLLLVEDIEGNIVYCSYRWPSRLERKELPWPGRGKQSRNKRIGLPAPLDAQAADAALAQHSEPRKSEAERDAPAPPPASGNLMRNIDGHDWHFGLATSNHSRVAVGVNAEFFDTEMKGVRNAFLLAMPFALAMIGLGAWFFSNRAMRPLQKLCAATHQIAADKLDQRIPQQGEDREFAELINVFNGMLERLERSFNQARRFSADAAHELKTPLAILQGQLERAIGMVETGSPVQVELGSILDEARRLSTISRKLLLLSQADSRRLNLLHEPFDLSRALNDLVEDIHLLASDLTVTSTIEPGLTIPADVSLFPQILHNLVSNAIKYNIEKGWIIVSASSAPPDVRVTIANSSSGMVFPEQERLFERFFRADPAHSRHIEGVGLGLSVSREIARAHGGDITFSAGKDGSVQFALRMPTGACACQRRACSGEDGAKTHSP